MGGGNNPPSLPWQSSRRADGCPHARAFSQLTPVQALGLEAGVCWAGRLPSGASCQHPPLPPPLPCLPGPVGAVAAQQLNRLLQLAGKAWHKHGPEQNLAI